MRPDVQTVMQRFDSLRELLSAMHTDTLLEVDVTMSQAQLMFIVSTRPGASMSSIAAMLGVGLSAVSGLTDRLVEHGYVQRAEDPTDRRQQLISLTPDGREVLDRMRELDHSLFQRLLGGLSASELATVGDAIDVLVRQAAHVAVDPGQTPETSERTPV